MKRALIVIASVGLVAAAVGVEAANAQYGSPAPPAYTPQPAVEPSAAALLTEGSISLTRHTDLSSPR